MSQPQGQWPPRSPHEAQMSTPGGRDRLRQLANRTSPTPSPIKRSRTLPSLNNRSPTKTVMGSFSDEDEEEDEEMLQLRLQEIQARLRLKKLQKFKDKEAASDLEAGISEASGISSRAASTADTSASQRLAAMREQRVQRSGAASLHVPVSPVRKTQVAAEAPKSPGRVLLGIDKGLKASDISLRRAPSLKRPDDEVRAASSRLGNFLQRSRSQSGQQQPPLHSSQESLDAPRPKSFSERMRDVRNQEVERREKDARISRVRNRAFDVDDREMMGYKQAAAALPEVPFQPPEFTRDQVLNSVALPPARGLFQRNTSAGSSSYQSSVATTSTYEPDITRRGQKSSTKPADDNPEFDVFSSLFLSKRILPHNVLTRTLAGKKCFSIPDLLKSVKAPEFCLPDIDEDVVLLAVIASKSAPKQHQSNHNSTTGERAKYMVMTLTDLKWELDLFLFNSGFEKFWKLQPGAVIAILNPNIMPPMKKDTGKFSVTVNSSSDTVLEIGSARDLGFCKSVKKDGKTCDSWIDTRHTEFCDFHTNEVLKKTKAGRMEVNTMDFKMNKAGQKNWEHRSLVRTQRDPARIKQKEVDAEEKLRGIRYIKDVGKIQMMPGRGRSTAAMLDDDDIDPDAFHNGSKSERLRKRLAEAEREREIATKLGSIGGGAGADYLRRQQKQQTQAEGSGYIKEPLAPLEAGYRAPDGPPTPPDARKLGLLAGKATDMHLSPIKRKRALGHGTQSTNTVARGWGGGLTKELVKMKDGERLMPVKKKTRILTEKGIRTPGRESFGGESVVAQLGSSMNTNDDDDDDDDDLEIV